MTLDSETKAVELPEDHAEELRLWLRLLTCTTLIEGEIRSRLRERFDVTLPRFDLMAQLDRVPQGLTLGEISRRLMVTNGNVTALAAGLVADGLVERRPHKTDRRVFHLCLTDRGRQQFAQQSAAHEAWVAELFAGVAAADRVTLHGLLGMMKVSVRQALIS